MGKPQIDGYRGMMNVYMLLRQQGFKVELAGYYAPFDILVDSKIRVEVKTCAGIQKNGSTQWAFNIQRHGKISEETDFYILRLENVPYSKKKALHLMMKAPLKTPTIKVDYRSLVTRYSQYGEAFENFRKQHKKEVSNVR